MNPHRSSGWHLMQTPGPTNVPAVVAQALSEPTLDHRSDAAATVVREALQGLQWLIETDDPIALFPASGTGASEAALVNTLPPGGTVLLCEAGLFARRWGDLAERLGLRVIRLQSDWRRGPDLTLLSDRLRDDRRGEIAAVLLVHNETSTGVAADVEGARRALDDAQHPALLLVDAISSIGAMPFRHDEWRVDVTVCASQKGLMLPPGLGFNVVGERAGVAARTAQLPRSYWDWSQVLPANETGFFAYTPATNMLRALQAALERLAAEGKPALYARHARHAAATRQAVEAWGLELYCTNPTAHSASLTTVLTATAAEAETIRARALELELTLGIGLDAQPPLTFRIGHLGDFNDLMLAATLCGVELSLLRSGLDIRQSGVAAALPALAIEPATAAPSVR
jgi:alanine-glyoxylate transaminase / serine-glyoxylate transaminase / serine-pyruvate transaminase